MSGTRRELGDENNNSKRGFRGGSGGTRRDPVSSSLPGPTTNQNVPAFILVYQCNLWATGFDPTSIARAAINNTTANASFAVLFFVTSAHLSPLTDPGSPGRSPAASPVQSGARRPHPAGARGDPIGDVFPDQAPLAGHQPEAIIESVVRPCARRPVKRSPSEAVPLAARQCRVARACRREIGLAGSGP